MTHRMASQIAWRMGDWRENNVEPDAAAVQTLAPGRWTLHRFSTVPVITVDCAQIGVRQLTWGDVFEIPEGLTASVRNTSAHKGDIRLAAIGTGLGADTRPPATLTVPASFVVSGAGPNAQYISRWVDVRGARRAFLVLPGLTSDTIAFLVHHRADTRGLLGGPNTQATVPPDAPLVIDARTMITYDRVIPLGIGSGDNLDPASAPPEPTVQELRPHALLDAARVLAGQVALDALGFNAGAGPAGTLINAFFVMEY